MGRGARKSNTRAKTSTLHLTPETAIDTTPRCAPHRRRGNEETMKPTTADAHTQKDTTMHPSRRPPTPPHRQRHHLRPGEDGSAGNALPSTTRPTETNHQTEYSGGKRQSPLRTPRRRDAPTRSTKIHKRQDAGRPVYAPPRPPPRTSSSVTTSLLLSTSHTPSSFAFWTARGSANSV